MNVFVTGANGFVGQALCRRLLAEDYVVSGGVRKDCHLPKGIKKWVIGETGSLADMEQILRSHDVLVHLAGRAHVMHETLSNPADEYRRINVDWSCNLLRQAASSGVKRFIFISTIKVNGENTRTNAFFTEKDIPAPIGAYAISKYEAERGLFDIAQQTGMELVIIRPPLVYGPGVKGNFRVMLNWIRWGIPLPFGAVHNKRSLVGIDNLVDLIIICIRHPEAANQIFLVSDGEDISTTELLRRLGRAINKPARLFPMPPILLQSMATVVGRREVAQRLLSSLRVDITKAREKLGWTPPFSVDEGLRRCVKEK